MALIDKIERDTDTAIELKKQLKRRSDTIKAVGIDDVSNGREVFATRIKLSLEPPFIVGDIKHKGIVCCYVTSK